MAYIYYTAEFHEHALIDLISCHSHLESSQTILLLLLM
jgi:hypothetical protein